jgi:hypothetical protein
LAFIFHVWLYAIDIVGINGFGSDKINFSQKFVSQHQIRHIWTDIVGKNCQDTNNFAHFGICDFLHLGFYVALLAKALALLALGIGAVWLFPRLRPSPPVSSVEALRNLAIGLGVLVSVPVATVLIAVTVIGIPIAVVLGVIYVVLFYTSTLVVAYFAAFLTPARVHPVLRTALCLLVISLLVELPWVGDGLNVLIRVFGMGCVAVHVYQLYAARRLGAPRSSPA